MLWFVQGHLASSWQRQDLNQESTNSQFSLLAIMLHQFSSHQRCWPQNEKCPQKCIITEHSWWSNTNDTKVLRTRSARKCQPKTMSKTKDLLSYPLFRSWSNYKEDLHWFTWLFYFKIFLPCLSHPRQRTERKTTDKTKINQNPDLKNLNTYSYCSCCHHSTFSSQTKKPSLLKEYRAKTRQASTGRTSHKTDIT